MFLGMTGRDWLFLTIFIPSAFVLILTPVYLEIRYYEKHPEKKPPDVSMWP